jgi:hypothetical protein
MFSVSSNCSIQGTLIDVCQGPVLTRLGKKKKINAICTGFMEKVPSVSSNNTELEKQTQGYGGKA